MLGSEAFFNTSAATYPTLNERSIFHAVPHGDGTWDVIDTRTAAVVANVPTQLDAAGNAGFRNSLLDGI
jgi:hypothetical protein